MKFRTRQILLYLFPCVVLFAVHYNALRTWFFMDDFAWLGLRIDLNSLRDLLRVLFEPMAQGTVRTLSERLFFLVFSSVFGMHAGPPHYWVFFTQCGSLVLANAIVRRISGSAWAGAAAATFWALSHVTSVSLAWLSAYNEILCGFLMLAAFYCLIRFVESGERRFWMLQWAAYLTSFLALEVTVVYPAIACFYLWISARQYLKRALWLWIPSLAFTAVHFILIPPSVNSAYKLVFNTGIIVNLGKYALKAVGPADLPNLIPDMPGPLAMWVAAGAALLLAIFLCLQLWKRNVLPLVGVAWFVFFLVPVLPLQNHFSEYYVTIASFGLAMVAGWAFDSAMKSGWAMRVFAVAAIGIFAWCEIAQVVVTEQWYRRHSGEMHVLLDGMEQIAQQRHADTVLMAGIDDELYISGMLDNPFRFYGIHRAYLVPGAESLIRSIPKNQILLRTDESQGDSLIADPKTVVVAFDGRGVADITDVYRALHKGRIRVSTVEMADPRWSARLGPGWYEVENEYRWMPRRATVLLDTPDHGPARLSVTVYCPQLLLDSAKGKLTISASAAGESLGTRTLTTEGRQVLEFDPLSAGMLARKQLEITLEVSHVVVPPTDGRELGVPVIEVALKTP